MIATEVTTELIQRAIHPGSTLAGGKGGKQGLRGLGGKGGLGAPPVPADGPCPPASGGKNGTAGKGRDPDMSPPSIDGDSGSDGHTGTIFFSRLNESQARSIGLIRERK